MKLIKDGWDTFAAEVFEDLKPSQVQIKEMQKAFYAGAYVVFCLTNEIGTPQVSEQQALNALDNLAIEFYEYKQSILKDITESN